MDGLLASNAKLVTVKTHSVTAASLGVVPLGHRTAWHKAYMVLLDRQLTLHALTSVTLEATPSTVPRCGCTGGV